MIEKTGLLLAIPYSLYSKKFYREVAKNWVGRSFVYLLLVLALNWVFASLIITSRLWDLVEFSGRDFAQQLPVIHIQDGIASTDQKGPNLIQWTKNPKTSQLIPGNLFAVIDTHHQYKDFEQSNALILVDDKTVYIKHQDKQLAQYHFTKGLNTTFGPQEAIETLMKVKKYVYFIGGGIVYLVGLSVSYVKYLIFGLIYGLIGLIFNANLKRGLRYDNLLSLALVSFTPSILLKTILFSFGISFPLMSLLYFLIPIAYLYFAIKQFGQHSRVK